MPTPLIVEGPDGSGKSTLLRKLSLDLRRPVFHSGGPPANKVLLLDKIAKVSQVIHTHLVDRTPQISDPIYSRAFDRQSFIPEYSMHLSLLELNPIVVFCRRASVMSMYKSIDQTAKPHKPPEYMQDVMLRYRGIVDDYDHTMLTLERKGLKVVRYDWGSDSYCDLLFLLKELECAA